MRCALTGIRDQLCLATKFTSGFKRPGDGSKIAVNFQGNSIKSMRLSVEASLKKLQTSYIDLLWMHCTPFCSLLEHLCL